MSAETRELVTWALGTLLAICALVGIAVRVILIPYLRTHLVDPMAQVKKQVTENSHHNAVPTVLDRIDDVQKEIRTFARAFDGHLEWSQGESDRLWREIEGLKRRRFPLWPL